MKKAETGFLVAVGHQAIRRTSTDGGQTWSEPTKPERGHILLSGCFGNGRIVAVGKHGGSSLMTSTTDGETWEPLQKFENLGALEFVTYGGGTFIAIGGDVNYSGTVITHSEDGLTWTKPETQQGNSLRRITWGEDRFVAIGARGRIAMSKDGKTWENVPDTKPINTLIDVTYGNGRFVGVGLHGMRMSSEDGLTWTEPERGIEGEHSNAVIWTSQQFAAIGFGATLFSKDGLTWTRTPNENAPQTAIYTGSDFIGTRWKGRLLRSEDAITWTELLKSDDHLEDVTFFPAVS